MIAWLVDELVGLGHDVTLFASGDSKTKATLQAVWPRALRLGRKGVDPKAACAVMIEAIAERACDFDVVHSHVDWLPLPVLSRARVPFLTTMHGRLDLPGLSDVIGAFPEAPFVSISDNQRRPLPEANWIATIQHGLPRELLQPCYQPVSYLAFSRTAHGGEGTGRCRTHRTRREDAAADRGQDTARGDGLLQEEDRTRDRRGRDQAHRRGGRNPEAAVPRQRGRPPISYRLAGAIRTRHDRGDGVRYARDRIPLGFGAESRGTASQASSWTARSRRSRLSAKWADWTEEEFALGSRSVSPRAGWREITKLGIAS